MSGTHTFFVARTVPTETVSICNAAVIGTAFVRDEPLVDFIDIEAGSTASLSVSHVQAADTIGNILAINLRVAPGSELTD